MSDTVNTQQTEPASKESEAFEQIPVKQNAAREAASLIPINEKRGYITPVNFTQIVDMAKFMAASREAVPGHLRGNTGMCVAIYEMALDFGFRAYGLANLCYVVNNRLGFEAQLMMAVINKHAGLKGRLRPVYEGEGDERVCVVRGHFRDEIDPCEYRSPKIGTITPKNSPLWKVDPDRQLFYYSARAFVRMFASHVMLGIFGRDEIEDNPHLGAEAAKDITEVAEGLHARIAAAKAAASGNGAGFHDRAVAEGLSELKEATGGPIEEKAAEAEGEAAGAPAATAEAAKVGFKDAAEYVATWLSFCASAPSEAAITALWNSQRTIRKKCAPFTDEQATLMDAAKDARIEELKKQPQQSEEGKQP